MVLYSIYWLYFFANLTSDPAVQYKASEMLTMMLYVILAVNAVACVWMSYLDCVRKWKLI